MAAAGIGFKNNVSEDYPYYATVAASQTAQLLGTSGGAKGDLFAYLIIIPGTTSPGNVVIKDGSTSITVFTGGATSVQDLKPFVVPLHMLSVTGPWAVTTGANVTAIAVGGFT